MPTADDIKKMVDSVFAGVNQSEVGPIRIDADELGNPRSDPVAFNVFMTVLGQAAWRLFHPRCNVEEKP